MHIHRLNRPIFDLDAEHPARRFLDAFVHCRRCCVGQELAGVDQEWWSSIDMRPRSFHRLPMSLSRLTWNLMAGFKMRLCELAANALPWRQFRWMKSA